MWKEFWTGHGGEGDVKIQMDTESPKYGMKQANTFSSPSYAKGLPENST